MPLKAKGSCLHAMNVAKWLGLGEGLREPWLAYVLQRALRGLQYFHDQGHIHRDIKAGNILLGARGDVALADFGVSARARARAALLRLSRARARAIPGTTLRPRSFLSLSRFPLER